MFRLKSKNKLEEIHDLVGDALNSLSAVNPSENWKNSCLNIIEQYIDSVDDIDPNNYCKFISIDNEYRENDGVFKEKARDLYENK